MSFFIFVCRTVFYLRCRFFICVVAFYLRSVFSYLRCGFFICVVVFLFALWDFFALTPVGHRMSRSLSPTDRGS